MATYFVEINDKFMVKIEHDGSLGGAEHHFLDNYNHVWGALAFDQKSMKTDTFIGCMLHDVLISEDALAEELRKLCDLNIEVEKKRQKLSDIDEEISHLQQQLRTAQEAKNAAHKDFLISVDELKDQRDYMNADRH